jgi:hypothetical protein
MISAGMGSWLLCLSMSCAASPGARPCRAIKPHFGAKRELEAQKTLDAQRAALDPRATPVEARKAVKAAREAAKARGEPEEETDAQEEGSVASSKLYRVESAPGTKTPQSIWEVRARARHAVVGESRFIPWRSGLRSSFVDARKDKLIAAAAKEWIPYGAPRIGIEPKMEKVTAGFMYPAENEKED